jgi:hypothetical protein
LSKKNDDFFNQKKSWSKVKDELLAYYLKPYIQKILLTHKPLIYIDCFAGKGRFEDGEIGSPLIALEIIDECSKKTKVLSPKISTYFIDLNYKENLMKNLKNYQTANIISGKFEEEIIPLLDNTEGSNIFLYIDPYGISALQYPLFENLAKRRFNSIELLINLNSFGFIREGCRVLGLDFTDPERDFFDDLLEYDPTILDENSESKDQLTRIAGGEYWIDIIHKYKERKINGYQAEAEFAKQYCENLMKDYKYVLNIPVKIHQNTHPKYRMVHVTNHHDGCLIMVNNMYNKWQILQKIQGSGQGNLFDMDFENKVIDESTIIDYLIKHLTNYHEYTKVEVFLAEFFTTFGPCCSSGDARKALKNLEDSNKVIVKRNPEYSKTRRKSVFMESGYNKEVSIRSIE